MTHPVQTRSYESLTVSVVDGVATVTIDSPPLNVLGVELVQDLRVLAAALHDDEDIRVVVVESADPEFFLSHGDSRYVTEPELMARASEGFEAGELNFMQVLHERLRSLPQVTIAKIAGLTRGGGLELAASLDLRFAALGKARFAHPEAQIGIIPGGGGTQYLPRLIGRARTLELVLSGELIDAETAERYGLVNRALPAADLDDVVDTFARRLAALPPGVLHAAVQAVGAASDPPTRDGLAQENAAMTSLLGPAATRRSVDLLERGMQTREGELDLERLLLDPVARAGVHTATDSRPRVLVVGFTAEAADLSGVDIDVDELRATIAAGDREVEAAGYDVVRGWIGDNHAAGLAELRQLLTDQVFDAALIGNGVRGVPRFTELFEQIVNAVHELAPRTRFAFNVDPPSTLDALRRVL